MPSAALANGNPLSNEFDAAAAKLTSPFAAARLLCTFNAWFRKKPAFPVCRPISRVTLTFTSFVVFQFSNGAYCVLLVGAEMPAAVLPIRFVPYVNDGT